MRDIIQIQKDVIDEFGSKVIQEKYAQIAERGLWESEAILIKRHFKLNSTILDIGCGSGRTTIPLLKMGYSVIGKE